MKLWVDACLTPTLEGVAHKRGYEATSNRRRGVLAAPDAELFPIVVAEDWVLVTNNEIDFRGLAVAHGLHPGLVILQQGWADQQRAGCAASSTSSKPAPLRTARSHGPG